MTTLNPNATPFYPERVAVAEASTPTHSFRKSKANIYRKKVQSQLNSAKSMLLAHSRRGDYFLCSSCMEPRYLIEARLAHIIPLKILWMTFEELNPKMDVATNRDWTGWRQFHKKNAELALFCKSCEAKM